jgi:hypothetical protein
MVIFYGKNIPNKSLKTKNMKTGNFFRISIWALSSMIVVFNTFLYQNTTVLNWILRLDSIFPIIFFAVIVVNETRLEGSKPLRKILKIIITTFFILVALLNYLIWKNSIFINSLLISLVAFLPAFLCTFLFKEKEKTRNRKNYLKNCGYEVDNPVVIHQNGDMYLRKKVTSENFLTIEVNKHYKRIMNDKCSMGHNH